LHETFQWVKNHFSYMTYVNSKLNSSYLNGYRLLKSLEKLFHSQVTEMAVLLYYLMDTKFNKCYFAKRNLTLRYSIW